jgi:molybdopterin-guanine dinucleotide biosynthesis protein A
VVVQAARALTPGPPTGFVVAGGLSRRMGRDKALLPWGGATLLDHALDRLRRICGRVFILAGPDRRYEDHGAPVLLDSARGAGPLAGLVAGLAQLGDEPGLFLAVDLPEVPVALLAHLVARAAAADAVVPLSTGGPEPLCAAYGKACLAPARRRLAAGEFKMTSFWPDVRVAQVSPDEWGRFGPPETLFRNLNTPNDLPPD